jgi:hypothetical protein
MRAIPALLAAALVAGGCAPLEPRPARLTHDDVIQRAKSALPARAIIEELERTATVLPLSASDIVRLHEAGVPREVLDYMQRAQIEEIRWRDRYMYFYGPDFRGFYPCPWPHRSAHPSQPIRGWPWPC